MRERTAHTREQAWRRYRRLMKWMTLIAFVAVCLALAYLKIRGGPMPLPMILATIFGIGVSVMLGTALMGLLFLSSVSGHDMDASEHREPDDHG